MHQQGYREMHIQEMIKMQQQHIEWYYMLTMMDMYQMMQKYQEDTPGFATGGTVKYTIRPDGWTNQPVNSNIINRRTTM